MTCRTDGAARPGCRTVMRGGMGIENGENIAGHRHDTILSVPLTVKQNRAPAVKRTNGAGTATKRKSNQTESNGYGTIFSG